jgi:hypothetical protein
MPLIQVNDGLLASAHTHREESFQPQDGLRAMMGWKENNHHGYV